MRRLPLLILAALALPAAAEAEVVTLAAAASIQGGNPFFSDVRVFNTSYSASLFVTATYQCFIATVACPAAPPQIQFALAPRESKAFDDMVANPAAFGAHDTAGGIEFEFSGAEDQLVVTSRLFSTSPLNSVGMFIPGLHSSKAFSNSVLTSIRHDPGVSPPAGFRTNVGAFNPGDTDALAQFFIVDSAGTQIGATVARNVPAHSGVQVSGIFEAAGAGDVATDNAEVVVISNFPLFTYAAVLDNRTADPILVVGAANQAAGSVTPTVTSGGGSTPTKTPSPHGPSPTKTKTPMMGASPTMTPMMGASPTMTPTRTPTQPGPSPTPTPTLPGPTATFTLTPPAPTATATRTPSRTPTAPGACTSPCMVTIHNFYFSPSTVTVHVGDVVQWNWSTPGYMHSTTSGSCPGGSCSPDGHWDSGIQTNGSTYMHTFTLSDMGTRPYYCRVHLAGMQGTVIVMP